MVLNIARWVHSRNGCYKNENYNFLAGRTLNTKKFAISIVVNKLPEVSEEVYFYGLRENVSCAALVWISSSLYCKKYFIYSHNLQNGAAHVVRALYF